MVSCTSTCASTTPAAGTGFILRGCDTWANANFPLTWTWSGTSGATIYVGVDQTWYNTTNCPSNWNRPIFNAGGTAIQSPECTGGHKNQFLSISGTTYVTFDWLELKGLFWNSDQQSACFQTAGHIQTSTSDNLTFSNLYFHDWTHGTTAGTTDSSSLIAYVGTSSPYCESCVITNAVIDNTDGDGADCSSAHTSGSMCSGGGVLNMSLENSVVTHTVQGFLGPLRTRPSTIYITGNTFSYQNLSFGNPSQSSPPHPNVIETTGVNFGSSGCANLVVANNLIYNTLVAEQSQIGNPNECDYVVNNLYVTSPSNVGANGPEGPQQTGGSNSMYFYNNTVVGWNGCFQSASHGYIWSGTFDFRNNNCIGATTTTLSGTPTAGTLINSSNSGMSNATATSYGLTSSEAYQYSPPSIATPLYQAGANLTSVWPAGVNTSDTAYGCTEQTINTVVQAVCPARAVVLRPGIGAWDIGAYEATGAPAPAPVVLISEVAH